MNYLAHFFLSHGHESLAFGNFLTDMMRISEIKAWPNFLTKGVELHHLIDEVTDNHPENKRLRGLLRPYFHKYAGVALDMYYDYVLYQQWEKWALQSFESFREDQYKLIRDHHNYVPNRLSPRIRHMVEGDFLRSYTTLEGQAFAFHKMNERSNFDTGFEQAVEVLPEMLEELNAGFELFFPVILDITRQRAEELASEL